MTDKCVWCFFLRSLPSGGVERQYIRMANLLSQRRRVVFVCLFAPDPCVQATLNESIEFHVLFDKDVGDRSPLFDVLRARRRLKAIIKRKQVGVVYSGRELANLIAALAVGSRPSVRVLWGHRVSHHRFSARIRMLLPFLRAVQPRVHCQIANSRDGLDFYRSLGMCRGRSVYIPNLIDFEHFYFSTERRNKQRTEWGIENFECAIGIVGRIAQMKNHAGFIEVAARLFRVRKTVRFFIIGSGDNEVVAELGRRADDLGLRGHIEWLPAANMQTMPNVYCGLDVLCSTSLFGEGFPNVIAEAMACDCPVVTTDVGEAANIVGSLGTVVPPGDYAAFCKGLLATVSNLGQRMGARRRHIRSISDEEKIIDQIVDLAEQCS